MKKIKRLIALILTAAFVVSSGSVTASAKSKKLADAEKILLTPTLTYFAQVIDYYYIEDINVEKIVNKALKKITSDMSTAEALNVVVAQLNDPYSAYYSPEEYKNVVDSDAGSYCGIGATIRKDEETGALVIVEPQAGSPAKKAGLKAGDMVYKVDGVNITKKTISEIQNMVKGEKGTKVVLTVKRKGKNKKITVTRDEIVTKTVKFKMLEDNIGYIKISQFEEMTVSQFDYAVCDLEVDGMKKLIIDLRGNPGGLLSSVSAILDRLLPSDMLLSYMENKYGDREDIYTEDGQYVNVPIVVLVDGNSASASELFTGAMKDYQKATIIGTTTFGKGIVQGFIMFTDGGALKLTTSKYYTPNGVCIHKTGIEPDLIIEDDPDTKADEVLNLALEYIEKK